LFVGGPGLKEGAVFGQVFAKLLQLFSAALNLVLQVLALAEQGATWALWSEEIGAEQSDGQSRGAFVACELGWHMFY
jgi:hypothetical protein